LLKHGEIRCTKVCPNARLESAWLIVAGHMKKEAEPKVYPAVDAADMWRAACHVMFIFALSSMLKI